jgi:hypothetical protein
MKKTLKKEIIVLPVSLLKSLPGKKKSEKSLFARIA